MYKSYAKFGHIGLPGKKKKQRALWCYNARSVTNHIADFVATTYIIEKFCENLRVFYDI